MKKLLFLLTVCVMSLPVRANTPPEELCSDEIFISFCNENLELAHLFKKLDKADLTSNDEVKCLKESLAEKVLYLKKEYSLFDDSPQRKLLLKDAVHEVVANNKIDQKVQEDCLVVYIGLVASCSVLYPYPDLTRWSECLALADVFLLVCLGIA